MVVSPIISKTSTDTRKYATKKKPTEAAITLPTRHTFSPLTKNVHNGPKNGTSASRNAAYENFNTLTSSANIESCRSNNQQNEGNHTNLTDILLSIQFEKAKLVFPKSVMQKSNKFNRHITLNSILILVIARKDFDVVFGCNMH